MTSIRFASFNASLNRDSEGQLITDLSTPDDVRTRAIAEIIQRTNPDVVLVNELDFDEEGTAAQLFLENYLEVSQNGSTPVDYPFFYVAPSNTGIASGFDLDNDGNTVTEIGQPGYGNDSFGFGNFPGQFGMVLYSKFPIDEENIRTFQNFVWQDMPEALLPDNPDTDAPDDWYSPEELAVFRLSSKSHWDIPIDVDGEIIHVLASHPTPPVFDGPEDRNGRRNHDEIRFWADYITPGESDYIYDDTGVFGGLGEGERFVIMGDQNADPSDGDSTDNAILQLLDNPLVNTSITPASEGGPEQAELQGGVNASHTGDPAFDTSDFGDGDGSSGNLRVDYVLPSANLAMTDAQVFWPLEDDPLSPLVENSDHRLVWVDVDTELPPVTSAAIYEIQGNEHISPFVDETVLITGIVTVVDTNGFYLQDAMGDEDELTSDGIFVFTSDEPDVNIGDEVEVLGTVSEFIPGGADTGNLSITQISDIAGITVLSTDNELPEAVIIGVGGRIPPTEIIDNDNFVNFDPEEDGIDFYETLEGMLVQLEDAVAVSPTNRFGEIFTLVDDGTDGIRTNDRGGLTITPDDFNPERVQVQRDSGFSPDIPAVNVGDSLGDVTGVVGYSFGNFEVLVTEEFTPTSGNLEPETTDLVAGENQLTVASFNVLNLDPNVEDIDLVDDNDPGDVDDDIGDGDFAAIASTIANNLQSPDIIALQEIQDSDGAEQTGNVDASVTYETLIDAIIEAGGPEYSFFDLPPEDRQDGGQPGGNIRVGYLYNPERVDLLEDTAERLGVGEEAFDDARKSLAVQFEFNDETLYLVNNHFSSKGGSSPLFGQIQPPINGNEEKREQQAQIINDYVDGILAEVPDANIVVLGDLNEFQFLSPLEILEGGDDPVLTNLTETLPENDRYTFIFQGNSQALDHILISDNLLAGAEYDIVHTDVEFADQASDHDPLVASFNIESSDPPDNAGNTLATANNIGILNETQTFSDFVGDVDTQDFYSFTLEETGQFDLTLEGLSSDADAFLIEDINNNGEIDDGEILDSSTLADNSPEAINQELPSGDYFVLVEQSSGDTDYQLTLEATPVAPESFQLQILHAADQEGGLPAILDAVNFSAVINALEDDFENTLKLSSGDIYIPGPFFNASDSIYGEPGIGDILINNAIGFQAVAFGNHEFDLGPGVVGNLIRANPEITGPGIGEEGYQGTEFPYLSTNLDFSNEESLADLVVPDRGEPEPNSIAGSVVLEVGGEEIGIVGATTPALPSISTIGDITVSPTDSADIEALAAEIQIAVDALTETGIDKVILLAHMQQISIEEELATLLRDVDVIMAGGSNTLLANPDDPLRDNDTSEGPYPIELTSASDEPVFVINTDGNYQYVGRLVADFDENGIITDILDESGVYATDDEGVDRVYGEDVDPAEVADPVVVEVTEAIADLVLERDRNIFGQTEVFLDGTRGDVRTEETNLGNLTADANLFIGQEYDPEVVVSIKNGGGIRDNIGVAIVPPGSTSGELEFLPPPGNPLIGKEEGNISQLDIENSLRFNNALSLVTVTAEELKQIVEHGVAATEPGATPGQFSQIGGMAFSFDPTREAIAFERDDEQIATGLLTDGDRVRSLAILNEDGSVADIIVRDGEVVGDADREIRLVTLSFLANGNDGYPFPLFAENRVDLAEEPLPDSATNLAEFADPGTEQDALAEYLAVNFPADDDPETPVFEMMEVPPEEDERIQNLSIREDTVLPDLPPIEPIEGTPGSDLLTGTPENDIILGFAGNDTLFGGLGNDSLSGGPGNDFLIGGEGSDTVAGGLGRDILIGGPDGDTFVLEGSDAAVANPSEADLILAFQVNFLDPTTPIDTIGLTGGLTEDDLNLELVNGNTFIRVAESNQILAIATNVTPERLNGNFVLV